VAQVETPNTATATAVSDGKTDVQPLPAAPTNDSNGAAAEAVAASSATPVATETGAAEIPPLPDFGGMLAQAAAGSIDLLKDVELNVKIELGRAEMTIEQILKLNNGSVVELDKLAGDPVDVLVNEQLVARGEVLVVNDNFCVRINEILPGATERAMKE
jgi:flagellar motor switch protein FliN